MKTYKEEIIKRKVVDKEFCDWCGNEIKDENPDYVESIDIRYKLAYSAWGDYWIENESWDTSLCKDCMNKVKKFLLDNNVKLRLGDEISYQ
jgi:hypothetical protein